MTPVAANPVSAAPASPTRSTRSGNGTAIVPVPTVGGERAPANAAIELPHTGTIASGILNISNTILGSGMLAMPFAISNTGLAFGLVTILFSGLAAAFGLWLLTHVARHLPTTDSEAATAFEASDEVESRASRKRDATSFFALSEITYPGAAVFFDGAIAIKCFGVACSYLVVIGDLMPEVVAGLLGDEYRYGTLGSRSLWILLSMAVVTPLSFAHRLDSLRHTSMVALAAVAYLVMIVIYFFCSPDYPIAPGEIEFVKFTPGFFKALPIFVFAFTCHQNIFAVYNEIADNSQSNLNVIVSTSISVALVIYFIIGTLGYIMFGDSVAGNIIRMYPVIPLVTYGRLALAVLFLFSFPIQAHPCRASLTKIVAFLNKSRIPVVSDTGNPVPSDGEREPLLLPTSPSYASIEQDDPRTGPGAANQAPQPQAAPVESPVSVADATGAPRPWYLYDAFLHTALTTAIVTLAFAVAMTVKSLDRVLGVVGATGSTTICYILPGLFYYKLNEKMPWSIVKIGAVGMATLGVIIMVLCLTMQFA